MNPRNIGGSIWLLLFGAASVLLIGAFTRFDSGGQPESMAGSTDVSSPEPSAAAAAAAPGGGVRTLPSDLSAGLAEIIKMAQAHIPGDTILAYLQNSGQTYSPTADEILYLTDLGVSDRVIAALLKRPDAGVADAPALAAAPPPAPGTLSAPATPPEPAALSGPAMPPTPESMIDIPSAAPVEAPPLLQNPQESYFYNGLAPYGDWVQTPDGWGWQPMVASVDAGWMPYCDRGRWVLTDDGWYWQSDYSWGWAAFHYGRWRHDGGFGWVWIPGNVWAPAWVAWRNTTEGFSGWAALPPGVLLEPGVGLVVVSGRGGFKTSYGLNAASFTFVPQTHFLAHNPGQFAVERPRAVGMFRSSAPVNNYSFSGGRILNLGVSAGQIATATGTKVPKMALREVSSPEAAGDKSVGRNLAVFRPNLDAQATKVIAEKETPPVLINKTAHPFATDAVTPRGTSARRATVVAGYDAPAPRSTATSRNGFNSSSFDPPASRVAPSTAAPALPTTGWQALRSAGDTRRIPTPGSPAPEVGYPAYSQRGVYPPPPVPGNAQFNSAMPRHAAVPSAPSYEGTPRNSSGYSAPTAAPPHSAPPPPPAPAENHGSGGQSSQGSGSAAAGSSANSSKTSK
jgi:hypothetical protein